MSLTADPDALHRTALRVRILGHETVRTAGGPPPPPAWRGPAREVYDGQVARRRAALVDLGHALEGLASAYDVAARLAATPLDVPAGLRAGDGEQGPRPDVRRLQLALAAAGHPCGPADGIFGPLTQHAVLALQHVHRLPPTGVADPATLLLLGPATPAVAPGPPVNAGVVPQPPASAAAHLAGGAMAWAPGVVLAEATTVGTAAVWAEEAAALVRRLGAEPVPVAVLPAVSAGLGRAAAALGALVADLRRSATSLLRASGVQQETEAAVAAALTGALAPVAAPVRAPVPAGPAGLAGPAGPAGLAGLIADRAAMAKAATRFVGTPYLWGGAAPGGFDCSGLTSYVYATAGITIPRTSELQSAAWPSFTDAAGLRPGDLVFYGGPPGHASHVVLYLGGGRVLSAPETGERVRVQALWPGWYASHVPR